MTCSSKPIVILMAEDDDDDFLLTQEALVEARVLNELRRARDGVELVEYLRSSVRLQRSGGPPEPALILLDLNMPRKDGREALREIKETPELRHIPIVVLTTSRAEEDILDAYALGVNSFVRKPVTFEGLVDALRIIGRYWFEIVDLPVSSPVKA